MPDPTFGCGTVLAGFGGGNLSEGGGGDRVWGGNDDDDDPPVVDGGDRVVIDDGGGGGGGGGPTPGPATPGGKGEDVTVWVCTGPPLWQCNAVTVDPAVPPPAGAWRTQAACVAACHGPGGAGTPGWKPGPGGPTTPGAGPVRCNCRMSGAGTTGPRRPVTPGPGAWYTKCWKQKCDKKGKKPSSLDTIEAETLKLYSTGMKNITVKGTPGNKCETKNSCKKGNKKCKEICISWLDPEDDNGGNTFTQGGDFDSFGGLGGVDDGTGGGFTTVDQAGDKSAGGGLTGVDGGGDGGFTQGGDRDSAGGLGGVDDGTGGGFTQGGDRDSAGGLGGVDGGGGGSGFTTVNQAGEKGGAGGLTGVDGGVGDGLASASQTNKGDLMQSIRELGVADLNNAEIQGYFQTKRPTGIIDSDIAMTATILSPRDMVTNDVGYNTILGPVIHRGISYVLKNNMSRKDWDSTPVYNVNTYNVINSLNSEFLQMMRNIKHSGGKNFTDRDIFKVVGTRIIEGSLGDLDINYLKKEARKGQKGGVITIKKGNNPLVNEMAALSILEKNLIPLDPSASTGRNSQMMQNWKVLSTDIAKYLPVMVDGVESRYYIRDDDKIINRTSLQVKDGDYININVNGVSTRLYCKSQKNHAFITDGDSRQKALELLGSDGKITLGASLDSSTNVDFDYSLSSPRENLYVLSGNFDPSALKTFPVVGANKSTLLKNTSATYELVPIDTTQDLRNFNDFILYKANYKTFMVDTHDQFIDYMVSAGKITLEQDDILFDTAKTNPSLPLLTRRIPWYIIIYPTNKFENLLFNSKSKITTYDISGTTTRKLKFSPTINKTLSNSKSEKFIKVRYGYPTYPNVYGDINTVSRISELLPTKGMYKIGCTQRGQEGSIKTLNPHRTKTGFRLIYEIIRELNTNYFLDNQGLGKGLNSFDVFSRINMTAFNKFIATENAAQLLPVIRNGLIEGVEVSPPVRNAGRNAMRKTRLLQRKAGAPVDTFRSIKAMSTGFIIEPPGTAFNSSRFVPDPAAGPLDRA